MEIELLASNNFIGSDIVYKISRKEPILIDGVPYKLIKTSWSAKRIVLTVEEQKSR